MDEERRTIQREKDVTGRFSYSSLKDVKTAVEELIAEFGEDARLDLELKYMPYEHDPSASAIIAYQTLETDEEMNARIRRKRQAERVRKMQYEQLKKEFG